MEENEVVLPPEDDIAALENEAKRRRKEGRADDAAAMQAAVCILLAVGMIALNLWRPDIAGELFFRIKSASADATDVMPDPIGLLLRFIEGL